MYHIIVLLEPTMRDINRYIIQRISAHWEDVAYALEYTIPYVERIKNDYKDSRKCCKELFKNWLTTEHGAEPKTWETLLARLKEVEELASVCDDIPIQLD